MEAFKSTFVPFSKMLERIEISRGDSDTSLFYDLMLFGEMVSKLVVAGIIAGLQDDRDRSRYTHVHKLVRASGVGDWASVADEVLVGPSSQCFVPEARNEQKELTIKCGEGNWQFDSVRQLDGALGVIDPANGPLPTKVDARRWLQTFARLRNKTRGHGAVVSENLSRMCPLLEGSVRTFIQGCSVFRRPWAYLHRNLSGKYRVTPLSSPADHFNSLKQAGATGKALANGVYVFFDQPSRVELVESGVDALDFYIANGGFTDRQFEMLSYATGSTIFADSTPYLTPTGPLPQSATEGMSELDVQGNCFANLPQLPLDYVSRTELETELLERLIDRERHPVVTLHGRGGTGKTSLALSVLHAISEQGGYPAIVWFSARDIDLTMAGPKQVKPRVFTISEIAAEFARLTKPTVGAKQASEFFASALSKCDLGPTLFVFDNFETLRSPIEVFKWLDTYIRPPNKILITARHREFTGDYQIEVLGMTEAEAGALMTSHASRLGISDLITPRYKDELYRESAGHPYVIRVLLGEVAKARKCVTVEKIVAGQEGMLTALFERTFANLSPAAQRVFLTLSNWRSTIPQIALEAVLLRPQIERLDVEAAIDELVRFSFIDVAKSDKDDALFVGLPLTASIFGEKKLAVSPMKAAIEADTVLLQLFGAAQRTDVMHGVGPRIERLVRTVASKVVRGEERLDVYLPMLEFVAGKHPPAWLLISELQEELNCPDEAQTSIRRYLELTTGEDARRGWTKLLGLCRRKGDGLGELQALVELSQLPETQYAEISSAANRVNQLFKEVWLPFDLGEKVALLRRLIAIMERRIDEADATDCSRLAWLCLHTDDRELAKTYAVRGLDLDPQNWHCRKLSEQPSIQSPGSA
ncbi:MAG TPA: NB-ARC domain-containing protein [Terriglobia bacterium]|nr:NB-ARC domain-containing protein [Terriglobia bacterium]